MGKIVPFRSASSSIHQTPPTTSSSTEVEPAEAVVWKGKSAVSATAITINVGALGGRDPLENEEMLVRFLDADHDNLLAVLTVKSLIDALDGKPSLTSITTARNSLKECTLEELLERIASYTVEGVKAKPGYYQAIIDEIGSKMQ